MRGEKNEKGDTENISKILMALMFLIFLYAPDAFSNISKVSEVSYLSITKVHVGTKSTDVGLTGIIQVWVQPNILRLRRENKRKGHFYLTNV